jgi:hypothetical protein
VDEASGEDRREAVFLVYITMLPFGPWRMCRKETPATSHLTSGKRKAFFVIVITPRLCAVFYSLSQNQK